MKRNNSDLPLITQKILYLINEKFNGNVSEFSRALGLNTSSKINRLFKKDSRNNEYPMPSTDVLSLIAKNLLVSADWMLNEEPPHVNNINITANRVRGNNNIVADDSTITTNKTNKELLNIITKQQEQIAQLLNILQNGRK